jgi:transcriptional regulator with XRE-family HTH domain
MDTMSQTALFSDLLRDWRRRRRLSQLDLACDAEISTKYLSALETGHATPNREMVLLLADRMNISIRERNVLLAAAGFVPLYRERRLTDMAMKSTREAVRAILTSQEPNPAVAMDQRWMMIASNQAMDHLIASVDPLLLRPPINFLRLVLHPAGLAPRIINLRDWREHTMSRLRRQIEISGDMVVNDLLEEIRDYPLPRGAPPPPRSTPHEEVAVPFRLVTIDGDLSFVTTTTVFAAPTDVTLSEIMIDSFFPIDAGTVEIMGKMADGSAISRTGVPPAALD